MTGKTWTDRLKEALPEIDKDTLSVIQTEMCPADFFGMWAAKQGDEVVKTGAECVNCWNSWANCCD